jgi:hypothetical protein
MISMIFDAESLPEASGILSRGVDSSSIDYASESVG